MAILLTTEGAARYATGHSLGILLYTGINEGLMAAYKMGGTPQTIVVSSQGTVVANWNGAYIGRQKDQIEKFFGIELPEIDLGKGI